MSQFHPSRSLAVGPTLLLGTDPGRRDGSANERGKCSVMTRRNKTAGVSGSSRSSIDVLLTEDVGVLGKQGSIVRVKPGYARNFLVPQGLAAVATEHNKRMVDRHKLLVADLQVQRVKQLRGHADAV